MPNSRSHKKMKLLGTSVLFILPFLPFMVSGEITINEIMYDLSGSDTDREWVEIYNGDSEDVSITVGSGSGSWRFTDSSPHVLNLAIGSSTIPAGGYAVIAKNQTGFLTDFPSFFGTLFTSSISLPNTSATLSIKNGSGNVLGQVSYSKDTGANGDGSSLQKSSSGWTAGVPTPGFLNNTTSSSTPSGDTATTTSSTDTSSSSGSSSAVSAHSSPAPLSTEENKIEFEISAGRDRLTSVDSTVSFIATPTKLQNLLEQFVTYDWSFGDGTVSRGSTAEHSYKFPGEYSVVVNARAIDRQAVSRLSVVVISPDVAILKVPGGLEVVNKSKEEINMEKWNLTSKDKTFIFPKDTLIAGGRKVIFADEVTGNLGSEIKLLNPVGKEFAFIKSETVAEVSVIPSVNVNLAEVQAKIDAIKSAIAQLSPESEETPSLSLSPQIAQLPPKQEEMTEENSSQTSNVALVFEAPEQAGFVSTIFSWPIKGFNFLRHLFVED